MSQVQPNILLLYTGGTIGMVRDAQTSSLRVFDFKHLLDKIPELAQLNCQIHTISFDNPIDSSDMNPDYWIQIANIIESHYNAFDGFVILHGSDTMSYTSSALSFMLENLAKPVIFTGSQLPIGDIRTDAKENLMTSIELASLQQNGTPVIKEVCLYFEYKLFRANRTTKINAENFEAFASYNYPELAESGVQLKINHPCLWKSTTQLPLKVHKSLNQNIALLKLYPGITESFVNAIFNTPNLKGVILETFGVGNCMTDAWFINSLNQSIQKGIYIVNITQCKRGRVNMGHYETSSQLKNIGVISGKDLTPEAAICKLMFLLKDEISAKEFKLKYENSLCGELS